MKIKAIVACGPDNGIGINNQLPWHIPSDLANFKSKTINSTIIMGKNTFDSLPYRPLKGRKNIVISSTLKADLPVLVFKSLQEAIDHLTNQQINECWVIGGVRLFQEAFQVCNEIHLTRVFNQVQCDVFLPVIPKDFKEEKQGKVIKENGFDFQFSVLTRL